MSNTVVVLVPVDRYDQALVDDAVRTGLSLLGGIERFVSPDEKILLKPNLLAKALPQRAITTHPTVFEAVAKLLVEKGYQHVSYGDSPGSPTVTPRKCAEGCGLAEPADRLGLTLADFEDGSTVTYPAGKVSHAMVLANGVQQADALINLCKMKTHALERITGAVKNMYGCILGINKGAGHVVYPNSEIFADYLIDINRLVKPRLAIMDGITAMEGNGPSSGTPIDMKMLLFSDDPVALDSVFAALVHLDPKLVPTCVSGQREGLGVMDLDSITVRTPNGDLSVSDAVAQYGNASFDVFRGELKKSLLAKVTPLLPMLQSRPKVDLNKCIACGICERACPVPEKAVHSGNGQKARYDYKKCIKCYCCQEMCPAKAINVYRPPLSKLLGGK